MRISDWSSDVCSSDLLGGLRTAEAHLDQLLRDLETGEVLLDDERRDALVALVLVGLRVDQQHVGDRAVGDEDLAAIEIVEIALTTRRRAHRADRIGAGARFGEADRKSTRLNSSH